MRRPESRQRARRRRGGYALMLVMVAVLAAMMLSSTYLAGHSMAVVVSRNLGTSLRARAIAESGLRLAVAYVQRDDDWRAKHPEGTWLADQPFDGGTFSVIAQDGWDIDGDGNVDGDGNFLNDWMNMLTLTCIGRYGGATHTVQAIVPPFKRLLMIVNDPAALSAGDAGRCELAQRNGWKVSLLRAKAGKDEFDEAAVNIHVVYFPAQTELESDVKEKLREGSLPVVTGHPKLVKELKIASDDSRVWSGASIDVLELSRRLTDDWGNETDQVYTHYITRPFSVGPLAICRADSELLYLCGDVIGTQALAGVPGYHYRAALAVLETGALQTDKKPTKGRRVALPWGGEGFALASLNADGETVLIRSLDWAGSSWRGYLPGIAVWEKIEVKDTAEVDGFASDTGAYGGGNLNGDATLSTNAIGAGQIKISGGLVRAHPCVSPEADPATVIEVTGGAVTGTFRRLTLNVPILVPEEPNDMPGSSGDRVYSEGVHVIDHDKRFKKLVIQGDAVVHISGDVRILCEDDFKVQQSGRLVVRWFGSLTLYARQKVEIKDTAKVNVDSADPAKLSVFLLKEDMAVKGQGQVYAMVQTYDAPLTVADEADFHGTFIGRKLTVEKSAGFHIDTSNSGTIVTLGGGYDLEKLAVTGVRWAEKR